MMKVFGYMLLFVLVVAACSKSNDTTTTPEQPGGGDTSFTFKYTDSVFYLDNNSRELIVKPVTEKQGTYYGFPDGIEINKNTGEINVSKSESGLRYAVSFLPSGSNDTLITYVTISGINYMDGFYRLSTSDSVISPVYNGNAGSAVPGINDGSMFDIGSGCNDQGCNVMPVSGNINLAQTVRNGVFGKKPANNDRHEFDLVYQLNDPSKKATNKLKVKLYYFETMADVTPEAYDIINSRTGTIVNTTSPLPTMAVQKKTAKPRPPCIFIVGR